MVWLSMRLCSKLPLSRWNCANGCCKSSFPEDDDSIPARIIMTLDSPHVDSLLGGSVCISSPFLVLV